MLPGGTLGYMRAMTNRFLTDTCTIEARSASVGEYGEPVEVYTTVAAAVPCRLVTIGIRFRETAQFNRQLAREALIDAMRLIVPYSTALDVDQRVTMSSGDVYTVADLVTDRTDETDRQAILVRAR